MVKKFAYCWLLIMFSAFLLIGCSQNTFHAVLYDDVENWIREDFIDDHRTGGAYYGENSGTAADSSLPGRYSFTVKSEEEASAIFNEQFDVSVDYGSEMLVVYTFTTVYHRTCELADIRRLEDVLHIRYRMKNSGINSGDASLPYQRWFVIKMDSTDAASLQVDEQD